MSTEVRTGIKESDEARKRRIEALLFGEASAVGVKSQVVDDGEEALVRIPTPPNEDSPREEKRVRIRRKRRRSSSLPPAISRERTEAIRKELEADRNALNSVTTNRASEVLQPINFSDKVIAKTVVLTGASSVGKTQMIETYAYGATKLKPKQTLGVERIDINQMSIWDTSGDTRFFQAVSGLIKVADALLVLYNPLDSQSLQTANKYFEAQSSRQQNTWLIATQSAKGQCTENDFASGKKLAQVYRAHFVFLDPTAKSQVDAFFNDQLSTYLQISTSSPANDQRVSLQNSVASALIDKPVPALAHHDQNRKRTSPLGKHTSPSTKHTARLTVTSMSSKNPFFPRGILQPDMIHDPFYHDVLLDALNSDLVVFTLLLLVFFVLSLPFLFFQSSSFLQLPPPLVLSS